MSRYHATADNGNYVAYGLDHACGWFYQEETPTGHLVQDLDSAFTGLRRGTLIEKLKRTDAPERHINNIAMDLDPEGHTC